MSAPIWITEAEVVSLIDLGEAIQAVERGFEAEARGGALNLPKTHLELSAGGVHSLGGAVLADDVVGVKSWTHTPGGASPLLTLWRASDGSLLAVVEAFALGQYRTSAVAGAATHALSREDSTALAVLGTGKQALTQAAAVAAVRGLRSITVWGPDPERRAAFARSVENALAIETTAASSAVEAAHGADIITLVTRAKSPFLAADDVARGAHVNAVGAIALDRAEFDPKLLRRCDVVVSDSVEQARRFSRELADFYGDDDRAWESVRPVASVIGGGYERPADSDVTLLKAMGVGIADVSIGRFVYEQAIENKIGTELPTPDRSRPRLRSNLSRPGVGYV